MNTGYKKVFVPHLSAVCCLFAAAVYLAVFSVAVFPQAMMDGINGQLDGVGVAGVFGVALGSALAVAVLAAILFILAVAGVCVCVFGLVAALRCRDIVMYGRSDRKKRFEVLWIVSAVLQIVMALLYIVGAFGIYAAYLPTAVFAVACVALTAASWVMKIKFFEQSAL